MKILGISFKLTRDKNKENVFIYNRLMNAWQFWIIRKKFTLNIVIPAPSLFYQTWNEKKGWQEDHSTKYHKFFIYLKRFMR